ncbi:MAG: ABC transporter permease subunit, partial [Pirellulales bacterium]|nr:ABC transporter permease subunit [Pirellulales bacterium]
VAEAQTLDQGVPVDFVTIAPKDDGLIAVGGDGMWLADFDPAHPEVTWASLFLPVWYEGYEEPDMTWQSSFAGVGPEMKLGLWPLIFGTLKATFYCMLIGAPLALLAAIYTSEFSRPRAKATIKPVVEMMASLPSVVLGFLAALVFAPLVEKSVPTCLAAMVTLPAVFVTSAFLWHLMPPVTALRLERFRFLYCLALVPVGLYFAWLIGPTFETVFFAGNIMLWLDGQIGTGTGAWMMLLLPLSATVVAGLTMTFANAWIRRISGNWSRQKFVVMNLLKFLLGSVATVALAWTLSSALTGIGFDPRGTYVDTYVQRNALVVGFAMGFAVIPIIYTIAEDALSTVPAHLRSASLGAGATPWQTTIRIVMPTAMSGLFSALMIGLGRAVGETMIVLMAGGNTPVRDWNIFNGFRTLAANIAVELPEAVQGSTHFRTLFLAALALFVMTFFVNTIAELVRLRFRRRAIEL